MRKTELEEAIAGLRAENKALREQLAQALSLIAPLQQELEQLRAEQKEAKDKKEKEKETPSFVKPNSRKAQEQEKNGKGPRRRRAKEQNGARRRDVPTKIVEHKLEKCPTCAYPLSNPRLSGQRQVIELPPPQPVEITEHQLYKSRCARCCKWHYATVDLSDQVIGDGRSKSRIGVRIASLIAYLRTSLRMPLWLIREYLHTVHKLLISKGEIADLLHRVAETERVKKAVSDVQQRVRGSGIVHGDETGWRERGQNGYIWCFCTPEGERYYEYNKSRAGAVARRILGSQFKGTLVTDFYAAYNEFPGEHQRCWVHLLRDLHKLKEEHKKNEEVVGWANKVSKLHERAQEKLKSEHGEHGNGNGHGNGPSPPTQEEREVLYIELVEGVKKLGELYSEAALHAEHPCHTLAKRLLRHQDELFLFVLQSGLSADNNLAERSVRPLVVMRKVSGGSQSARGSRTRMTLASLFGTWRAKGLNPFTECSLLLSQPLLP